jgi:hypothetical protein
MNGALLITWGAVVRGREAKALEVFQGVQAYWDEQAKEGKIHDHRSYFNLVGKSGGMTVVNGELDSLLALQGSTELRKHLFEAQLIIDDLESGIYVGGDEQSIMQIVGESVGVEQEFGYFNP